jgi:hypothetical protein
MDKEHKGHDEITRANQEVSDYNQESTKDIPTDPVGEPLTDMEVEDEKEKQE